ncbi:unnamed protein product [Cylicocyclus nassatus]|uniref:Uncharacterized protein n=1 Tax=Cylicocyclus nassatus TaxID=53992 RepID=A0AA36M8M1_CYLNA|nr:unnamed protein product [Cylicocyclus nassatus]
MIKETVKSLFGHYQNRNTQAEDTYNYIEDRTLHSLDKINRTESRATRGSDSYDHIEEGISKSNNAGASDTQKSLSALLKTEPQRSAVFIQLILIQITLVLILCAIIALIVMFSVHLSKKSDNAKSTTVTSSTTNAATKSTAITFSTTEAIQTFISTTTTVSDTPATWTSVTTGSYVPWWITSEWPWREFSRAVTARNTNYPTLTNRTSFTTSEEYASQKTSVAQVKTSKPVWNVSTRRRSLRKLSMRNASYEEIFRLNLLRHFHLPQNQHLVELIEE